MKYIQNLAGCTAKIFFLFPRISTFNVHFFIQNSLPLTTTNNLFMYLAFCTPLKDPDQPNHHIIMRSIMKSYGWTKKRGAVECGTVPIMNNIGCWRTP